MLGDTPQVDRAAAVADLKSGLIQAVFTVDVFNEGVDVPAINTVLFLRPTETRPSSSSSSGEGCVARRTRPCSPRWTSSATTARSSGSTRRFRAMTGSTRASSKDIEKASRSCPRDTQIVLDRQSQELVLENMRSQVVKRWPTSPPSCDPTRPRTCLRFLTRRAWSSRTLSAGDRSWARLRRDAGIDVPQGGPHEAAILKRVRALAHVDDPDRAAAYLRVAGRRRPFI